MFQPVALFVDRDLLVGRIWSPIRLKALAVLLEEGNRLVRVQILAGDLLVAIDDLSSSPRSVTNPPA